MFHIRPAFIIPPLAYLTALLHAGCSGGASTVMRVFASILNMLFLSFMGSYLVAFAMYLYTVAMEPDDDPDFHNEHYYERMILAGGVIYLVFWGCILALWPFYHRYPINTSSGVERANRNYSPYGTVQEYPGYPTDTQPLIGNQ